MFLLARSANITNPLRKQHSALRAKSDAIEKIEGAIIPTLPIAVIRNFKRLDHKKYTWIKYTGKSDLSPPTGAVIQHRKAETR